jgi:hypothetical protein
VTPEDFTRPERGAAVYQARRLRTRIRDAGGCAHCTRRDQTFEALGHRAACGHVPPKSFPACVELPGGFELDEDTLR